MQEALPSCLTPEPEAQPPPGTNYTTTLTDSHLTSEEHFTGWVEKAMPKWKTVIFNDPCVWCGGTSDSKEHVTPTSLGGRKNECNTVGACARCNSERRSVPGVFWWAARNGYIRDLKGQKVRLIERCVSPGKNDWEARPRKDWAE